MTFKKKKLANALKKKLGLRFRKGKEQNGWYELDGKQILLVTMPHGAGDIPIGTANAIRNQVRLNKKQFANLVNCPLKSKGYEEIIRQKQKAGIL